METLEQCELPTRSSATTLLLVLISSDEAPKKARREVTLALKRWRLDALCDTAVLLTSELVTNAFHAIQVIRQLDSEHEKVCSIRFEMRPTETGGVRLEVTDPVQLELPKVRRPDDTEESGRGLFILDLLASRWGTEPCSEGKVVWAEIGGAREPGVGLDLNADAA